MRRSAPPRGWRSCPPQERSERDPRLREPNNLSARPLKRTCLAASSQVCASVKESAADVFVRDVVALFARQEDDRSVTAAVLQPPHARSFARRAIGGASGGQRFSAARADVDRSFRAVV